MIDEKEIQSCLDDIDCYDTFTGFPQGALITSHLPEELQKDVNLFLNCHELLSLSSRQEVNQVFVWHELKSYANKNAVTALPVGYQPCVTRSFLMIVGLVSCFVLPSQI